MFLISYFEDIFTVLMLLLVSLNIVTFISFRLNVNKYGLDEINTDYNFHVFILDLFTHLLSL